MSDVVSLIYVHSCSIHMGAKNLSRTFCSGWVVQPASPPQPLTSTTKYLFQLFKGQGTNIVMVNQVKEDEM
jgi:hypothetical protein